MQELRRNHPDWLEQRKISFTDGHAEHYVSNTLVISHCWEDSEQPDGEGVQFAAIKKPTGHRVGLVRLLVDAAGQGQGRERGHRVFCDAAQHQPALPVLQCAHPARQFLHVALLDAVRGFPELPQGTANGLDSTSEEERRDTIICIHNANPKYDPPKLRDMWGDKTAEQAYAILEKPDVKVTNLKDKNIQLPKLKKLNEFAKSAVATMGERGCPEQMGDHERLQSVFGWSYLNPCVIPTHKSVVRVCVFTSTVLCSYI